MTGFDAVLRLVGNLDSRELQRWIEESWVRPERGGDGYVFREIDIARVRLIIELRHELAIDEEALPLVLRLLDQIYALRRRLGMVRTAIDAQPAEVRDSVLARLGPDGAAEER